MSNNTQARLAKCFAAVFPDLDAHEIPGASPTTIAGWDSLASVTLMTVLEEEFNVEIPPDAMEHLLSFQRVLDYLNTGRAVPQNEQSLS